MVKSVMSVSRQGLRDWIVQRISAVYMALYVLSLSFFFIWSDGVTFIQWQSLFATHWMKVASLLFLVSLLWHSWIGMWTVFTDYVKCSVIRMILNVIVLTLIFASFFWGLLILWSV